VLKTCLTQKHSKPSIRIVPKGAINLSTYSFVARYFSSWALTLIGGALLGAHLHAIAAQRLNESELHRSEKNSAAPRQASHAKAFSASKTHPHLSKTSHKSKQIITETGPAFSLTPELIALADHIALSQDLPKNWVLTQLLQAKSLSKIKQLVMPPSAGVKKNWMAYRERFLTAQRIQGGQDFAQRNWSTLEKAQSQFQVPWEIIVSIIGVETFYGKNMGHFKALDVLTSLSMDFPASHPRAKERQAFFQEELGALLKLMRNNPQQVWLSSFAGAMGLPQFMPSNWGKFALDGDQDGRVNLMDSEADAIQSVANYLAQFGWRAQMPTHYAMEQTFDSTHLQEMLLPDILPTFKSEQLISWGLRLSPEAQAHQGPLALVMLENAEESPSYVLGTENFYTLTRYNWSSYYAMAVIELGQEIKAKRTASP